MRYRVFDDYLGRRWEVWQTNPPRSDRRFTERRAVAERPREQRASAIERRNEERRNEGERRVEPLPRFPGIPEMEAGWLCFESKGERKRLAPVPEAWESADDLILAHLCNFANEAIPGW